MQPILLLLAVMVSLPCAADPAPKPRPLKEPAHTLCMGLECKDGRRVRSELQIPAIAKDVPVYEGSCPQGFALAKPLSALPPGHAFLGRDQKKIIIDLQNPEKDLQDGDILLSSYDASSDPNPATQFFDGSGHAALVGTAHGKKFHMDSPWEMSGPVSAPDFRDHGWTVLRLRRYPVGVNSEAELARMQKDHPEKLAQWEKYRAHVLKRVNEYFQAMRRSPFEYNGDFLKTKVLDRETRKAWREQLFPKDGSPGSCPSDAVYCSELPTTAFALADEDLARKLPQGLTVLKAINAFDAAILKPELAKSKAAPGTPEWDASFERGWTKLVNDVGEGHGRLIEDFRQNEAKLKAAVRAMVSLPQEMRPAGFALLSTAMPGIPVSPSDLYEDIFREHGLFSYAGTVVPRSCTKVATVAATGEPNAGAVTVIVPPAPAPGPSLATERTRSADEVGPFAREMRDQGRRETDGFSATALALDAALSRLLEARTLGGTVDLDPRFLPRPESEPRGLLPVEYRSLRYQPFPFEFRPPEWLPGQPRPQIRIDDFLAPPAEERPNLRLEESQERKRQRFLEKMEIYEAPMPRLLGN